MFEFQPVRVLAPPAKAPSIPLVLDSPHSGVRYPRDFQFSCDFLQLRRAEDTHVDDLFSSAVDLGATLVCAEFPRSYIDPNRRVEDIDTEMLADHWPGKVNHSPKTASGIGLIWRQLDDKSPIYTRKLSAAEISERIERFHTPYWKALREAINAAQMKHRKVFHINCHSMPAEAKTGSWLTAGTVLPDIVLGDRDGSTCAPEFTAMLRAAFEAEGLSVAVNDPYKGVELVKQFGKPTQNRHSIQIEINRRLYMNEVTRERNENYGSLRMSLRRVLEQSASYAKL